MATSLRAPESTSEAAIVSRLLNSGKQEMSPALARHVLTLGFSATDQARMRELAERNQQATISAEEHTELMNYVRAGHLLALLQAKARKALRRKKGA